MADKKKFPGNFPGGNLGNRPGNKPGNKPGGPTKPKFNSYWIIGIILLAMIGIQFLGSGNSLKEIDNNRFFQILEEGDVEKIVIVNKEKVEVYIKPERLSDARYEDIKSDKPSSMLGQPVPQYYFTIISQDVFMGDLNRVMNDLPADNRPTYTTLTRRNYMGEIMLWILPFLLILGIWRFIRISINRRSRVKEWKTKESNNSDFKDKIEKLNSLLKDGLITEQEFNDKKADILRRI